MKALVFKGKGRLELEEIKKPEIKEGEALLKVKAAAICGTDLRILNYGHHHIPEGSSRILGHEIAGVIEEVSSSVKTLEPGMTVAVAPNIYCGACDLCNNDQTGLCDSTIPFGIMLDGGFAEYMLIPSKAINQGNIIPIKSGLDFTQIALNEPLSCCFNSLEYTEFSLGMTILIIGAGPIGIMHTLLANKMGAARVIVSEVSDDRLEEIKKFGADVTVNPTKQNLRELVFDVTKGRGADVAIVACGVAAAHNEALECLGHRGRLNFFGGLPKDKPMTTINANTVHYKHLKVVGTTRQSISQYKKTLGLIEGKKIDLGQLITGRFTLDQAEKAFRTAQQGTGLKNVFLM